MLHKPTGVYPSEYTLIGSRCATPTPHSLGGEKAEESDKSKLRRAKIVRLEQEQMLEDEIAVRIIQSLHLSTIMPFDSVQVEFHDLDGLAWPTPRPDPPKPRGILALPTVPFISECTPRARDMNGRSQGTFTNQELSNMASRVKTELKFPDISITSQEIADATLASYKSQTAYMLPPGLDYTYTTSTTHAQRGRGLGFLPYSPDPSPRIASTTRLDTLKASSYNRPVSPFQPRFPTTRP